MEGYAEEAHKRQIEFHLRQIETPHPDMPIEQFRVHFMQILVHQVVLAPTVEAVENILMTVQDELLEPIAA